MIFSRSSRVAVLALLFFAAAIVARPVISDETDDAIKNVILSQIEAFANEDKEAAWQYASEGIKRQSGSVDTFYNMVKFSYEPIHQATAIEFVDRIPHTGFQIQTVRIRGPEGKRWQATYRMEWNGDAWRIGGVALKESPGTI